MLTGIAALASGVVVALAGLSGNNMLQTARVVRNTVPSSSIDSLFSSSMTQEGVVEHLKKLKRKELLEIFASSRVCADVKELEGEWNGVLLDNNGFVMTKVSSFLSNGLFGMGRTWNGKAFGPGSLGINRFFSRTADSSDNNNNIDTQHSFEYAIKKSKILPNDQTSIQLQYSKFQFPLSLWYTMKDEVRLLPGHDDVLIGMGCMAWSGGMLNCQPFCLYKIKKKNQ